MGESREEVVDLGAAHELADRVVHHSLDGRAGNLVVLVEGASTALSTC
jgi:VCBS repeat-containing protein